MHAAASASATRCRRLRRTEILLIAVRHATADVRRRIERPQQRRVEDVDLHRAHTALEVPHEAPPPSEGQQALNQLVVVLVEAQEAKCRSGLTLALDSEAEGCADQAVELVDVAENLRREERGNVLSPAESRDAVDQRAAGA